MVLYGPDGLDDPDGLECSEESSQYVSDNTLWSGSVGSVSIQAVIRISQQIEELAVLRQNLFLGRFLLKLQRFFNRLDRL